VAEDEYRYIGHEAYREFESLPSDVDVRDFSGVHGWAYAHGKMALFDWMSWRWEQGYLRALDVGFEPATLYFGISTEVQRDGEGVERLLMLRDEDGTPCLVLFGKFEDARQYCVERAALDEAPNKERQEETGELVPSSPARRWQPKAIRLADLKANPRPKDAPLILDPTVEGPPGTRLTVAELEDND
jgi:hypothetical protein